MHGQGRRDEVVQELVVVARQRLVGPLSVTVTVLDEWDFEVPLDKFLERRTQHALETRPARDRRPHRVSHAVTVGDIDTVYFPLGNAQLVADLTGERRSSLHQSSGRVEGEAP